MVGAGRRVLAAWAARRRTGCRSAGSAGAGQGGERRAGGDIDNTFLLKIVQSPTVFILEEYALSAARSKLLQKSGAQIILEEEKKSALKKVSPLFGVVTVLCTAPDRKEKWLTLQRALAEESAEALIGMWYWKLRDLIKKDPRKKAQYLMLYKNIIKAHATAWLENIPLALLLEKIVLQK